MVSGSFSDQQGDSAPHMECWPFAMVILEYFDVVSDRIDAVQVESGVVSKQYDHLHMVSIA